jgi:uncharacterized protein
MDHFPRNILKELHTWKKKENHKPLILRGARQVGKTTIVNLFAESFDQYIYLNLETPEDRTIFESDYSFAHIVEAIFFLKDKKKEFHDTLIFIDEIQNSPEAISQLRYFYEKTPELYVIAAGSLLESLIDTHVSFPVGRVEYKAVFPCNFEEFLMATGEQEAVKLLRQQVPFPAFAHEKLLKLFKTFVIIGGMPEILNVYAKWNDLTQLNSIYDGLLTAYVDDVEKYARNETLIKVIRHTINQAFYYPSERIALEGFGKSRYKYREMQEAFTTLEKAMLLQLVYPVTTTRIPLKPNQKKRPKLQVLDTGLVNYFSGLQKALYTANEIDKVAEGNIVEHIVGQELKALSSNVMNKLHFWTREEKQSNAEVDYVYPFLDYLIPIEVKSGATGRLRSLHLFMDKAPHPYAVRVYSGKLTVEKTQTINKTPYYLLNLPFYLIFNIDNYLQWFIQENDVSKLSK